jgi:hypothetical protein
MLMFVAIGEIAVAAARCTRCERALDAVGEAARDAVGEAAYVEVIAG